MKVTGATIARTIVLAIALTNQILTASGINPLPFAEETIYELFSALFTLGTAAVAWWKNNSFTAEAIEADEYMKDLKAIKEEGDVNGY